MLRLTTSSPDCDQNRSIDAKPFMAFSPQDQSAQGNPEKVDFLLT